MNDGFGDSDSRGPIARGELTLQKNMRKKFFLNKYNWIGRPTNFNNIILLSIYWIFRVGARHFLEYQVTVSLLRNRLST